MPVDATCAERIQQPSRRSALSPTADFCLRLSVESCGPEILDRPSSGPRGSGDVVVVGGRGAVGGVELVEGLDDEAVAGQDTDPLAVAGMEFGSATGPPHASE